MGETNNDGYCEGSLSGGEEDVFGSKDYSESLLIAA